jgi:hypothetical protein
MHIHQLNNLLISLLDLLFFILIIFIIYLCATIYLIVDMHFLFPLTVVVYHLDIFVIFIEVYDPILPDLQSKSIPWVI